MNATIIYTEDLGCTMIVYVYHTDNYSSSNYVNLGCNDRNSWAMPQAFWKNINDNVNRNKTLTRMMLSSMLYSYLGICVAQVSIKLKL